MRKINIFIKDVVDQQIEFYQFTNPTFLNINKDNSYEAELYNDFFLLIFSYFRRCKLAIRCFDHLRHPLQPIVKLSYKNRSFCITQILL